MNNRVTAFDKDFKRVENLFPKLAYAWNDSSKLWVVKGELDICDVKGDFWGTFDIAILVPENYPHCIPQLFEVSQIIPREEDWHVSKEGACCVDFENKLIALSRRGINLEMFMLEFVYPFFANQLFKLDTQGYAGQEYRHHVDGLVQYLLEDLRFPSAEIALTILQLILDKGDLTRNKLCPCGSGEKIKRCHEKEINIIKSLGRDKIEKDTKRVRKWLGESQEN